MQYPGISVLAYSVIPFEICDTNPLRATFIDFCKALPNPKDWCHFRTKKAQFSGVPQAETVECTLF